MFGHPCAFVNGNMFFGTFGQSVVVRVGEPRTAALAKGKLRVFEPMAGRAWKEYVQIDTGALPPKELATLAREAFDWAARALPPKPDKKKPAGAAATKAAPARAPTKRAAKKR